MKKSTTWIEKAIAAVLARVIWFVVASVPLFFSAWFLLLFVQRIVRRSHLIWWYPSFFLCAAVLAVAIAVAGPWALATTRNRGLGKLAEIKAMSATSEEEERKKNIPLARPGR